MVKVSLSPAASIELIYGIPLQERLPPRSSTYKSCTVVRDYDVDQGHKEILDIFAPPIGEVRAERIQNDEILVRGVEQGLREQHNHQSHQACPIRVVLCLVVIRSIHHADAGFPNDVLVNDGRIGRDTLG